MINRVLIRLKVIQIVYAYYKNSGKSLKAAEDEVFFSLSKAYDLYNHMLLVMPAITHYAADRISFLKSKAHISGAGAPDTKFVENRFIAQLERDEQLVKFAEKSKLNWVDSSDFLRRLLDEIEACDIKAVCHLADGQMTGQLSKLQRIVFHKLKAANAVLSYLFDLISSFVCLQGLSSGSPRPHTPDQHPRECRRQVWSRGYRYPSKAW